MGKDVLAGVDGVLGQCNAVVEAPPARTPHQVYKPYITEPFWGNHANRVLAYLTMMGDQFDRGFSIPAQWNPCGRLDVSVIEAAPVLNANRWSVKPLGAGAAAPILPPPLTLNQPICFAVD